MRSVLVLLAMSFLLLPILPNRPVDPWQVLNPAEIWLLAILIAAVSFAGYIAVRVFGDQKGIAVAAIAGGMASSTATTLVICPPGARAPASARLLAGGILLAGVTMLVRIVVLAGVLKSGARSCAYMAESRGRGRAGVGAGACCGEGKAAQPNTHNCRSKIRSIWARSCNWPALIAVILLWPSWSLARWQRGAILAGRRVRHRRRRCADPLHGAPVGCRGVCWGGSRSYPGRSLGQHRIKGHDCRFRGRDAPWQHRRRRKRDGYWRPRHHVHDA